MCRRLSINVATCRDMSCARCRICTKITRLSRHDATCRILLNSVGFCRDMSFVVVANSCQELKSLTLPDPPEIPPSLFAPREVKALRKQLVGL